MVFMVGIGGLATGPFIVGVPGTGGLIPGVEMAIAGGLIAALGLP